jgi:very-long-chain ceramide synthase
MQHAFWIQQILIINIEKPRKDYWQMLVHHIVTTILVFTSYGYHQTKVANLILCIMDVVDLFFPVRRPIPPIDRNHVNQTLDGKMP